ncbi:MAG: ACT domain-containing protein [Firmicutes bacterium]|nr:ACT domain-containing protein [Bacillota bacterium]
MHSNTGKSGRDEAGRSARNDVDGGRSNRAVVSVVGKDRIGIIARVAGILAANGVNILDISQTIMQEFFTMIMLVDLGPERSRFARIQGELAAAGEDMGLKITIQHEDVFNFMHRV